MQKLNRRCWFSGAAGTLLLAASLASAAEKPNIVLCMMDDQGWGDVGYNGHEVLKTPVLDEMAASGLRFDRFYAAAPVCSPTRGSVLTGRHPNRFACFSWGHTLRPEEITLAEVLQQSGYATGHFGKWHLGPVTAESPVSPGGSGFDHWLSSPNYFDNDPLMSREGRVIQTQGESSHVTVDAAIEFIRGAAAKQQPFVAVVWFGSPHLPHQATEKYRLMYPDLPRKLQDYYGEITAADHAIGELREALRELRVANETLLWCTSDNGPLPPGTANHLRGIKSSLYEGGIRVPTVIEWPDRIEQPRIIAAPCGSVDIYPTVLEIAGAKAADPLPLDGQSLVHWIDGEPPQREAPLGFWVYPVRGEPVRSSDVLARLMARQQNDPPAAPQHEPPVERKQYPADVTPGHAAWIDGDLKLHRIEDPKTQRVKFELYDLAADPSEEHDLAAEQPERVEAMQSQLEAWQQSVLHSLNGGDY